MHNAMFRTEDVKVTGTLSTRTYTAVSGSQITQAFCPKCGTPMMAAADVRPQFRVIRFGVFDEPHRLRPAMAIWTSDAPDWAVIDPELEQYCYQPPPPSTS
jgi:hypothetical protein